MSEAKYSDPAHYKSFNEFFTRPLKDGVRPMVEDEDYYSSSRRRN